MIFPYRSIIKSLDDTSVLADKFIKHLNSGDLIVVNGNLGAGKTSFIKKLCELYNINNVTSPSFSIVNEYSGSQLVYHFDFYRIKNINELYDIGVQEYFSNDDAISFVEWGILYPEVLKTKNYEINIEINENDERVYEITKYR